MTAADETTTQEPTKRKASIAGFPNGVRPVKRRAAKACQTCRARKVRCDVVESGPPCNNCRLDQVQCVVSHSRRKRQPRLHGEEQQLPVSSQARPETSDPKSSYTHANIHSQSLPSVYAEGLLPENRAGTSFELELDHHVPHMLYRTQGHRISLAERDDRISMKSGPSMCYGVPRQELSCFPAHKPPMQLRGGTSSLPHYIRPLPPTMMAEDLAYLQTKGSLLIPVRHVRNAILRSYVEFVHPFMPILDLEGFLGAIADTDGSRDRISLLLIQAVLFAGSAFVDIHHLAEAGFSDRKAARRALFQRAKLLYNFECELDRISLVQSLLLMTSFYETSNDHQGVWHWMAITLSLAQASGLHRDPGSSRMEPKEWSLLKRIWWTCFMRESVIALGMRRPARIKDEDFDIPMLVLEDFDTQVLSTQIREMLGPCLLLSDTSQMQKLATMCIEQAKLCVYIGNVLSTQYSIHSHELRLTAEGTNKLPSGKAGAWCKQVHRCEEAIQNWYEQLPPSTLYKTQDLTTRQPVSEVVKVHQALLHLFYLALYITLHSPQSRHKVYGAADEIVNIIHDISKIDLAKNLPIGSIAVCLSAVVNHLLDPKCDSEAKSKIHMQCHQQCMEIFQRLRDTYGSAELTTSLSQVAIHMESLPVTVVTPTLGFRLERPKQVLLAASTPPAETCASESSSNLSWMSRKLQLLEWEPPRGSEEVDESGSSGPAALLDELQENTATCHADLDADFDALFDLDADMDFSAAGADADGISGCDGDRQGMHSDVEWTRCGALGDRDKWPGFLHERLHKDAIPQMRISIQV